MDYPHDSLQSAGAASASTSSRATFTQTKSGSLLKVGLFTAAALVLGVAAGVYFLRPNGIAEVIPDDPKGTKASSPQFVGWAKPDLAIVFTGQMHGDQQPCGCSEPQLGGLSRRYNFIKSLKDKGWPIVLVDVGEIAQMYGPQAMLKYTTSMKALKAMEYMAIGLGRNEFNMPLHTALGNFSLNNPEPTPIASNLMNTDPDQDYYDLNVRKYKIIDRVSPRVGIVSAVDPKIIAQVKDPASKFVPTESVLPGLLKEMRGKGAQINLLLYQGHDDDKQKELAKCLEDLNAARKLDASVPPVQIALCLSQDSEPPGRLRSLGATQVATVGHKGRYVGVLGLFRQGNAYSLKYELVAIGPQYKTPDGLEASNPVMKLMEDYAQTVKRDNYLAKFPRSYHTTQLELKKSHNLDVRYVGSEMCSACHQYAAKVWEDSKHSHAYDALVTKAKHPSLRQYDGECVVCHTVGFQHNTGFYDAANNERQNKKLLNVGCESCHGPGSAHANDPTNKAFYPHINPFRQSEAERSGPPAVQKALFNQRMLKLDGFCQKCHDIDNDVHWTNMPFAQKWQMVAHPTPKAPPQK